MSQRSRQLVGDWEVQAYLRHEIQEQTMSQQHRNKINVLDAQAPALRILMLKPGDMFNYADGSSRENVYMKLDGTGQGNSAVYLPTGMQYDVNKDAVLSRVYTVQIEQ